jgi:hypothetical protein
MEVTPQNQLAGLRGIGSDNDIRSVLFGLDDYMVLTMADVVAMRRIRRQMSRAPITARERVLPIRVTR